MEKGERLEARIEAQLREWAAELESLKAKADKAVAEARQELLRARRRAPQGDRGQAQEVEQGLTNRIGTASRGGK